MALTASSPVICLPSTMRVLRLVMIGQSLKTVPTVALPVAETVSGSAADTLAP
ncbi:MAG TPA: hypothetical protein VIM19_13885 [Actinomycetes bacterium]